MTFNLRQRLNTMGISLSINDSGYIESSRHQGKTVLAVIEELLGQKGIPFNQQCLTYKGQSGTWFRFVYTQSTDN